MAHVICQCYTHTHTQSRSSSGIKEDVIAAVPPYGGRNARRKLSRDLAVEDTAILLFLEWRKLDIVTS